MKKLIAVLLALILLVPVLALADDSDVVGCWASYGVQNNGAPVFNMLYLAENHTCYYIVQSFDVSEAGIGRTYVGTWEIMDDGTLYAKTGNNTDTRLKLNESHQLAVNMKTMDVYVNITPFTFK